VSVPLSVEGKAPDFETVRPSGPRRPPRLPSRRRSRLSVTGPSRRRRDGPVETMPAAPVERNARRPPPPSRPRDRGSAHPPPQSGGSRAP
jgi:hypothetical protein